MVIWKGGSLGRGVTRKGVTGNKCSMGREVTKKWGHREEGSLEKCGHWEKGSLERSGHWEGESMIKGDTRKGVHWDNLAYKNIL